MTRVGFIAQALQDDDKNRGQVKVPYIVLSALEKSLMKMGKMHIFLFTRSPKVFNEHYKSSLGRCTRVG